jgi:hypothetical protein
VVLWSSELGRLDAREEATVLVCEGVVATNDGDVADSSSDDGEFKVLKEERLCRLSNKEVLLVHGCR